MPDDPDAAGFVSRAELEQAAAPLDAWVNAIEPEGIAAAKAKLGFKELASTIFERIRVLPGCQSVGQGAFEAKLRTLCYQFLSREQGRRKR